MEKLIKNDKIIDFYLKKYNLEFEFIRLISTNSENAKYHKYILFKRICNEMITRRINSNCSSENDENILIYTKHINFQQIGSDVSIN